MAGTGKSWNNPGLLSVLAALMFAAVTLSTGMVMAGDGHGPWITDFDKALDAARKAQRPIMLVFSGSDWCIWCKRLHNEVLSQKAFIDWARDKMVLCLLDFPSNKTLITPEQRRKNTDVAQRFRIRGYPTVLILDSDGSLISRTGYRKGGAEAYVKHIEELLTKGRAWRDKLKRLPSMKGKERIDTAASLFKDSAEELGEDIVQVAEILFDNDKSDSSGLRGDAALIVAGSKSELAGKAEGYLKSISGTDKKHRYGFLLYSRTRKDYIDMMEKAQANRGRELEAPDVAKAAAGLERELRAVIPHLAEKQQTMGAVHLQLSLALALQGKKKAAFAELEKTKNFGIPDRQFQIFHRFIDTLGKKPDGQGGK